MRRRFELIGVMALLTPSLAAAAPAERVISLPAQPLASSLQAIAQRYGVELLFSQAVVGSRSAPAISGRMQAQQAIELVLTGSSLMVRRMTDGSFIVAAAPVAVSTQPEATPEILVIGRRTQNTDVRRTENDVRPYQVVTREAITTSHVSTIEELAAKRLPANAQGATASQQGASGQGRTGSSIDFRGIGTNETLILVDGRRLPLMPAERNGFIQSDVNAIPPEALERVEAITATAGGIYGPGATAGVVNLVLRRDYRGVDLAVTRGSTSRGDAPYRRVDLRVGFTPDHGATDVMIDLSRSNFGGLSVGDRDFLDRASARSFANLPSYFIAGGPPSSRSVTVISDDGKPLTFKPAYGGRGLGSPITFAAPADGRSMTALVDTLTANAGQFDATPSTEGASNALLSARRTTSIIASARHRSGPVELFVDYLKLRNVGQARGAFARGAITLRMDDPANPFAQDIDVYAPGAADVVDFTSRSTVMRVTGGAIVNLPHSWRGEVDYSRGHARQLYVQRGRQLSSSAYYDLYSRPRYPLGDYTSYLASFDGLFADSGSRSDQRNRFTDGSLRLAGPVVRLGGGDLSATMLAERREERVTDGTVRSLSSLTGAEVLDPLPAYGQTTRSFYGELRAPLIDARSGIRPLRGLEFQFAIRNDRSTTRAAQDLLASGGGGTRTVSNAGTVYTAGFKVSPIEGILLRGSLSTGQQPLSVSDLSRHVLPGLTFDDPKRPGTYAFFDDVSGGAPNPKPERAQSMSAGIVFQSQAGSGVRLSLDYTHIRKRGEEVISLANNAAYFIANEDEYPDRVTRLPLTAEDAALGYTAGAITRVDSSSLQNGRTIVDALDAMVDLRLATGAAGFVDLHGAAAWQLRFRRIIGFGLPSRNYLGSSDGAAALRANAGARWTVGPFSLSVDGQLVGRHRITSALEFFSELEAKYDVVEQGGRHIPMQATVDLAAEYRISMAGDGVAGRPRTLALRVGVQDLLDTRPATAIGAYGKYDNYLDPRRRRFELSVAAGF